jgi:gp16 family phage-associated protein
MFEHDRTREDLLQPEEVLRRFRANGKSVSKWAVERGYSPALVYAVLKRGRKCLRGQSHDIAVALKLKPGPDCPVP